MDRYARALKALQTERECVSRDCDRNCAACDLVMDREELLRDLDDAIRIVRREHRISKSWLQP